MLFLCAVACWKEEEEEQKKWKAALGIHRYNNIYIALKQFKKAAAKNSNIASIILPTTNVLICCRAGHMLHGVKSAGDLLETNQFSVFNIHFDTIFIFFTSLLSLSVHSFLPNQAAYSY